LHVHFSQKNWLYPPNKTFKLYLESCKTYKFNLSTQKGELMITTAILPSKFYLTSRSLRTLFLSKYLYKNGFFSFILLEKYN
jgi:hypothetical protein